MGSRWDKQEAPLPFSRVVVAVGDMIDLSQAGAEGGTAHLENIVRRGMEAVEREASILLGGMKQ